MNKELIAQVGDIISVKIVKDTGTINRKASIFPEYDFKTIAYYNGEGTPEDAQFLSVPVEESLLPVGGRYASFYKLNADVIYRSMMDMPQNFIIAEDFLSYNLKIAGWIFIGDICSAKSPTKIYKNDSCTCQVCKTPHYMAAPNQKDGTFTCYSCRDNPMRAYY